MAFASKTKKGDVVWLRRAGSEDLQRNEDILDDCVGSFAALSLSFDQVLLALLIVCRVDRLRDAVAVDQQ